MMKHSHGRYDDHQKANQLQLSTDEIQIQGKVSVLDF